MKRIGIYIGIGSLALGLATAQAEPVSPQLSLAAFGTDYPGSRERRSLTGASASVGASYLDRGGIELGASQLRLSLRAGGRIRQNELRIKGEANAFFNRGLLRTAVAWFRIRNDDPTQQTNRVDALALRLEARPYSDRWRGGWELAVSRYPLGQRVWQTGVDFGVLAGERHWLKAGAMLIATRRSVGTTNQRRFFSAMASWSYWPRPHRFFPEVLWLSGYAGRRVFAVIFDAGVVYNLADEQRGGISAGARWRLHDAAQLAFTLGWERFRSRRFNDRYDGRTAALSIQAQW